MEVVIRAVTQQLDDMLPIPEEDNHSTMLQDILCPLTDAQYQQFDSVNTPFTHEDIQHVRNGSLEYILDTFGRAYTDCYFACYGTVPPVHYQQQLQAAAAAEDIGNP